MTANLESERLAVLVHEVRSPVAALSAIAETLAEGRLDRDARVALMRLVALACAGIERIVTDVAVASIRRERVDVVELTRNVATAAGLRGALVELSAQDDVPAVAADPARLRQVLDNLVGNALAHGPADGPVSVDVRADAGMVRVAVSDRGAGIPAADLDRIFEPRVRLDPLATEGAGLGLALARAIAEGHGGTLTVTSSPGAGATFTLSLPLHGEV